MTMKIKISLAAIAAIVMILASCSKKEQDSGRRMIAASIAPVAAIAEEIAGDDFDVVAVVDKGADPETFEPSMSQRMNLAKADMYLSLGGLLPFEEKLADNLKSDNPSMKIAEVSKGIELIHGTHSHSHDGHEHGDEHCEDSDPHVWTSVRNAKIIAYNIADLLVSLNPDSAEVYRANAIALVNRLDSLDREIEATLSEAPVRSFMIWHPSLSYFSRDYGLRQIAVGAENKEGTPAQLKSIIDRAGAEGVKVLFLQKEFDPRMAGNVLSQINARTVEIDPMSADYESQMKMIADELAAP